LRNPPKLDQTGNALGISVSNLFGSRSAGRQSTGTGEVILVARAADEELVTVDID